MEVKGIILDELDLSSIRNLGFNNFRTIGPTGDQEMHYDDEPLYQEWINKKQKQLEAYSPKYMWGQDDAKIFVFSDVLAVQAEIQRLFPGLPLVTVNSDDYPLDYDYT